MSNACTDLDAICHRLKDTLLEIEQRIEGANRPIDIPTGIPELVSLSDATIAADKLRYFAHFQGRKRAAATANL